MNLNPNNYTSIATSLELERLGFPQKSDACFSVRDELIPRMPDSLSLKLTAAFTVSELFDALPLPSANHRSPFLYAAISRTYHYDSPLEEKYFCKIQNGKHFNSATMADAVALAIIYLLKRGKLPVCRVINSEE